MDPETVLRPLILVCSTDSDYQVLIKTILENDGFDVLMTGSADEALSLIQSQRISGIVVTSDIAIAKVGDEPAKLMNVVGGKIPTVTLITPSTWELPNARWVFEVVYGFPRQDYIHIPIGVEELLVVLKRVMDMKGNE
jgi:CheY-like chemotaxis protein